MNVFIILSIAFGFLLLFGFLWGMFRSWKKSLIRFGILVVDVLLSVFLTPSIVKGVIKKITNGTTFSIFNFSFNFSDIIENFTGSEIVHDLVSAESTTNELFTCLVNIVANLVLYLLVFFILWLLSLIIYGIVVLVVSHSKKKEAKEKGEEIQGQSFWKRLIGGGIGFISMIVIVFAVMVPVFGATEICDEFLSENQETETTASAASLKTASASGLYYTENSTIGTVETYIQTYEKYKSEYDSSFFGAFFNFTGLSKLGALSFEYLSNVSSGELDVNFMDEAVALISTYNAYKVAFVENEFNWDDNTSIDRLITIYDKATQSEIAQSYIVELLPTLAENWSNGEKFLGISCPVTGTYENVFCTVLKIYSVQNSTRLDSNIRVLFEVLKVANDNELIENINRSDFDIIAYLSGDYLDDNSTIEKVTIIKDAILTLSTTQEFKDNLPTIFNEMLKVLYDTIVGGTNPISSISEEQTTSIDWEFEATNMQEIVDELLTFYKAVEDGNDLIEELGTIGRIIDLSRQSGMLSTSLKEFIIGYISSDNVSIGESSDSVKDKILEYIEEKWDYTEHSEFSFEDTLVTISEVSSVVSNLTDTVSLESLSEILETIADNESVKEVIVELLTETDEDGNSIVSNLLGNVENSDAVVEVVTELVSNLDADTLSEDISAAESILTIVNANDENTTISSEDASSIVSSLVASDTVMGLLQSTDEGGTSNSVVVTTYIDGLDDESKTNLYNAASNLDNDGTGYKDYLLSLFEISTETDG